MSTGTGPGTGPGGEWIKRGFDLIVASIALVLLAPVMLIVAVLVATTMPGEPVLFRQYRPARHGVAFQLVKFRTMRPRDPYLRWITDADRITRVGRFLRATSLDELPTLWHVVRGQMSLVGPRPLLIEYLPIYTPRQARRHQVRPGITGLAQVRGRNTLSWDEKFDYDLEYVENRSLRLDLRILTETVTTVLARRGISASGHVTVPAFTGSPVPARSELATGVGAST